MPRGIDHLVLTARDLDAQAALYRHLGFSVGARNRHAWGTLNHVIQFPGCFLELITTEPGFTRPDKASPVAQFAVPIADLLSRREGMSQLVLESRDAAGDQAEFSRHGIAGRETFFFERRGKRPDGSDVHVAFTLAFADTSAMPDAGFFVCQQHVPENFWNPAFQTHANGVQGIAAVVMVSPDARATADFVGKVAGAAGVDATTGGYAIDTGRGRIEVVDAAAAAARYGQRNLASGIAGVHFAAVRFAGHTVAHVVDCAGKSGIACSRLANGVIVPADAAHGVALIFED